MGTIAEKDAIELEGLWKHDSSWHPCQVSLSSDTQTGLGLIVDFGSEGSGDVIFTKDEVLERLRFRSTPLQGDDCLHIKEGEHVLVSQDTQSGSLFFDAKVEKVQRVRHSKRIHCRCTFEVQWFHSDFGGTVTVPASSIMKLAINNIDTHPVVVEFLNSIETLSCSGVGSFVSLFDDTVFETDLARMLEKQIEEISKLADVKNGCTDDVLLEVKRVDLPGNVQHEMVSSHLHDQASPDQNNSKRTTRRQSKVQMEMASKNPPRTQPILEEPNRLHLSPLGACAALASLMYKLPPKEDLTNAFQSSSEEDANVVELDLPRKFMDSDVCIQEKVSTKEDFSSSVEAGPAPVLKHIKTGKLRSSDRKDASSESLKTRASSRMQNTLERPAGTPHGKEDATSSTFKPSSTCSISDWKLKHPMKTTRLTRSAIQKGIGHSSDRTEQESSYDEMKVASPTYITRADLIVDHPTKTTRLTRSAMQKGVGHSNDEVEQKSSLEEVEQKPSLDGVEQKSSHDETKLSSSTCTTRLTHAAIHKVAINVAVEVKEGLQDSKEGKDVCSDSTIEDLVTPESKATRRKKPVASPSDTETNASLAQERKKKAKVFNDVKHTGRSEGELSSDGLHTEDEKKKTISSKKMPEQRFSPRLRFLPRTRSQIKH